MRLREHSSGPALVRHGHGREAASEPRARSGSPTEVLAGMIWAGSAPDRLIAAVTCGLPCEWLTDSGDLPAQTGPRSTAQPSTATARSFIGEDDVDDVPNEISSRHGQLDRAPRPAEP